jgi:hypothetical protein
MCPPKQEKITMPKKSTQAKTTKRKSNLKVEDLPKSKNKLGKKEMEKVKGGMVLCRGSKKDVTPCI